MTDQEPYVVQAAIFHAYEGTFDDGVGNRPDRDGTQVFDAKVYALADEYGMPELKILALTKLEVLAEGRYMDQGFADAIRVVN